jgi:hypothetical protein
MDKLLHFLEFVRYLGGFCLVQVMRVRADAVRDVRQEVKKTPTAPTASHTRVCWRIPPTEDD